VVDIFQEHVTNNPSAIAARWNNEEWSYEALNVEANRIAHLLRSEEYGVTKGQRVAFFMEQSVYPVIAALAIVKAGGTYVPLDTSFPDHHIAYVLRDADVKVLIHDDATCERVVACANDFNGKKLDFDMDLQAIALQSDLDLDDVELCGDSSFQIIYTSGSTGKPKGIRTPDTGDSSVCLSIAIGSTSLHKRGLPIWPTMRSTPVALKFGPLC
jgi:acyl-coenzyme A synthetase/AMP-(fatty) acid ligase